MVIMVCAAANDKYLYLQIELFEKEFWVATISETRPYSMHMCQMCHSVVI